MSYVPRERCPFCQSKSIRKVAGTPYAKDGFQKWDGHSYRACDKCHGSFTTPVPDDSSYVRMYAKSYKKQESGEIRWKNKFDHEFRGSGRVILEVGGGIKGIRARCDEYYSVEFQGKPDHRSMFEHLTAEDIKRYREVWVDTIVTLDVIEHVLYPAEFFRVAADILPTGGLMYMHFGELWSAEGGKAGFRRQVPHINCPSELSVEIMSAGRFREFDRGKDWYSRIYARTEEP